MGRQRKGDLSAIGCSVATGFALTLGKLGLRDLPVATFSFWLFAFSVPMAAAWMLAANGRPRLPDRRGWGYVVLHAVLSLFSIGTLWAGIQRIDPTVAAFLNRTETILIVLLGILLLGERFRIGEAVGAGVAIGGVALMGLCGDGEGAGGGVGTGFWLVLAASVGFAFTELVSKLAMRHVDPTVLTFWRNLLLAAGFGAIAIVRGEMSFPEGGDALVVLGVAFLGPTAARILYLLALQTLELSRTAVITQTQPLFAAFLAVLIFGRTPGVLEWAGGLLITLGCIGVVRARAGEGEVQLPG